MLELHAADRVEALVDVLVDVLDAPLDDPFEREWVAVSSLGMRRWLTQQLARRLGTSGQGADGVAANIDLPFPAALRRAVLDADRGGEADPWQLERLVWPMLEILHDVGSDGLLAPLAELAPGATLAGRARRLADLVDRYSVHRPGLIRAWAAGHDFGPAGERLPAESRWQPALFRRVRDLIGEPSPPERLPALVSRLVDGTLDVELPSRLALFGLSTLPPDLGPLLQAMATRRQVRLLFLALSPALTRAVAAGAAGVVPAGDDGASTWSFPRRDDPTVESARHPLLRSWGQPTREFAAQLGVAGLPIGGLEPASADGGRPADLLAQLQRDLRANASPTAGHVLDPDDRAVQVHTCAGPTRQVEVVRDVICRLLADDPSLTEGDIVVMSPRIERFAPLLEAVLGPSADARSTRSTGGAAPALRYRITDRALREANPVLAALAAVLEVLPGRFTASGVTEVLTLGPVRRRFGLSPEDLALVDRWVGATNIRWGIDGDHRSRWGLPGDYGANTWQAGLDQLMMGVAIGDAGLGLAPGEVAPHGVQGDEVTSAARLALAVRTLAGAADALAAPAPISAWCDDLRAVADQLFAAAWDESWQRRHLDGVLERLRASATSPAGDVAGVELTLGDVRRLLDEHLAGDRARATFGTGAITMCSLQPLRSVPHRVVVLLGLDADALPRATPDGDDLLAQQPDIGDREPRAEARELLLEAVLAARQSLVITHSGTDVRTNQPVAPAVVLDELWDALADTVTCSAQALRDQVQVVHPRQAFDPLNFAPPARSFDPVALGGARALQSQRLASGPEVLVDAPLAGSAPTEIDLADVRDFLRKPVRAFFLRTLDVRLPSDEDALSDNLPVTLESLESWNLGDGLLSAHRDGVDLDSWVRVEQARGALPPATLGTDTITKTDAKVEALLALATRHSVPPVPNGHHLVDVAAGATRLVGVVGSCAGPPLPGPVFFTYSKLKPSQRLVLWLDLLALTVHDPTVEWRAAGVGRKDQDKPLIALLKVQGEDPEARRAVALRGLEAVSELYAAGLRQPLPLFDKTSFHLARDEDGRAASEWSGQFGGGRDAYHRMAFGDCSFSDLRRLRVAGRSPTEWAGHLWGLYHSSVEVLELDRLDDDGSVGAEAEVS